MHGASVLLGFLLAVLARELLHLVLPLVLQRLAPLVLQKVSAAFLDEFVPAFMGVMVRRLGQDTIDLVPRGRPSRGSHVVGRVHPLQIGPLAGASITGS